MNWPYQNHDSQYNWIFLTTYALIFRVFANRHAGCFKYGKYESFSYMSYTQQFTSIPCVLSTCQYLFCRQKHWVKHLIHMLLADNYLSLAHQSTVYSAKNSLTLQQKHDFSASLIPCVHPPCLSFFSRLRILKGHFEGQKWAKKSTNAHSVLLRWFNTSHPDRWTTHISPF